MDPTGTPEIIKEAAKSQSAGLLVLLSQGVNLIISGFFLLGPLAQYYPQYRAIEKGQGEAFSPLICFILLASNILRLFYRLGKVFDDTLVYQSIIMIFVQLTMMEVVCRSRRSKKSKDAKSFFDFDLAYFWQWDDFFSYVAFLGSCSFIMAILCFLFVQNTLFVEGLGYVALFIEAMLAVPQIYRNHYQGTTGLSEAMIWSWAIGDLAKTAFFASKSAPLPFLACGVVQVLTDIVVLVQIANGKEKLNKSKNMEPNDIELVQGARE